MSHDPNCLFCKIAAGEIPSTKVHEDGEFVAFRDIRPAAETHVLVIPRKHIETLTHCHESDAPLLGRMLILVARIADQLGVAYKGGETGFRTVINTGPGGGQEVYHLHAHILAARGRGCEWDEAESYVHNLMPAILLLFAGIGSTTGSTAGPTVGSTVQPQRREEAPTLLLGRKVRQSFRRVAT